MLYVKKRLTRFWSNEYVQGSILLTVASFIINLLNYFFNFFAGRVLGPDGYGELVTYLSYITILSVPMIVLSTIIVQKIGSHMQNQNVYAATLLEKFVRIGKRSFPFLILSLLIIPFMPNLANLSPIVAYLIIPSAILGFLTSFYQSVMQGMRFFFLFALMSVSIVVFKFASILLPVFHLSGINGVVAFQFVATIGILYVMIGILNNRIGGRNQNQHFHPLTTVHNFIVSRQFLITFISILSVTALSNIDIIYVKKFFTAPEAGLYSSWSLFAKIILYVIGPLTQIGLVFFASNTQRRLQEKILLISLALLLFVGLSGYLVYSSIGKMLIDTLFGDKFSSISAYLGLAALFGTGYAAVTFLNTYFLAKKSMAAILLGILFPFYLVALFIVPKQLTNIMYVNIIFCFATAVLYLSAYLYKKSFA